MCLKMNFVSSNAAALRSSNDNTIEWKMIIIWHLPSNISLFCIVQLLLCSKMIAYLKSNQKFKKFMYILVLQVYVKKFSKNIDAGRKKWSFSVNMIRFYSELSTQLYNLKFFLCFYWKRLWLLNRDYFYKSHIRNGRITELIKQKCLSFYSIHFPFYVNLSNTREKKTYFSRFYFFLFLKLLFSVFRSLECNALKLLSCNYDESFSMFILMKRFLLL